MEKKLLGGFKLFAGGVLVSFLLVSCSESISTGPKPAPDMTTKQSSLGRENTPLISEQDLQIFSDGQKAFCLDLYNKLAETETGNICISPYSISMALTMTYAGANGTTADEIAKSLHYDVLGPEIIHNAFNYVDLQFKSRGSQAAGRENGGFKLCVNNSLWADATFEIKSPFLDVLAVNYGAGVNILDFFNKPEPSRIIINDWVSEKTEQKIQDLIPDVFISCATRLVLTNSVYFDAAWGELFLTENTSINSFYCSDSDSFGVPSMHIQTNFSYSENSDFQMVELPYDGREISMVLILPKSKDIQTIGSSLTPSVLSAALNSLQSKAVNLQLPKFGFNFGTVSLKEALQQLGIDAAFKDYANFSGISDEKVQIGDVLHQTAIDVDEKGTTAAAATAVIFVDVSYISELTNFVANKPFLFLIRDIPTNTILFMGRVMDPRS